jgi:transcriptional regulator with XRE-family HTH domain
MYDLYHIWYHLSMESNDLFNILHNAVEAQQYGKKISQKNMAKRLNIPMRTYQDWRLGNSKPQAAIAIFKMLGELDDEDALRIIKKISKGLDNGQVERGRESST